MTLGTMNITWPNNNVSGVGLKAAAGIAAVPVPGALTLVAGIVA